jgi:hypothetical protein
MNTREEHLDWCKSRAIEYVEAGNLEDAFTSMMSDLSKHPETRDHLAIDLGMNLLFSGLLASPHAMREFIEGIN